NAISQCRSSVRCLSGVKLKSESAGFDRVRMSIGESRDTSILVPVHNAVRIIESIIRMIRSEKVKQLSAGILHPLVRILFLRVSDLARIRKCDSVTGSCDVTQFDRILAGPCPRRVAEFDMIVADAKPAMAGSHWRALQDSYLIGPD